MPWSVTPSIAGEAARARARDSASSCARIARVGGVEVAVAEVAQVVDRGDEPGERLERRRPGLEAVPGRVLARRAHAVGGPRLGEVAADRGDPEVRTEELVRRAEQDVDAERRAVRAAVRRVVHAVGPGERADGVRGGDDALRVGDRADRVGRERERDDPRARRPSSASSASTSSVASAVRSGAVRTTSPWSSATRSHGATFASWSRSVTTISSPGCERARDGVREQEVQRRHVRRRTRSPRARAVSSAAASRARRR